MFRSFKLENYFKHVKKCILWHGTDITISMFTAVKHEKSLVEPFNVHLLDTRDEFLLIIIKAIQMPSLKDMKWPKKIKLDYVNSKDNLVCYRGIYRGTPKLVIALSNNLVKDVIEHFHVDKISRGRLGVRKAYNKIRVRFHWPGKKIKEYATSRSIRRKRKPK